MLLRLISGLATIAFMGVVSDVRAQGADAPAVRTQAAEKPTADASPPTAAARTLPTRDRDGVVLVEQAGRVVALGIILNDDGRILTAASRVSAAGAGPLFVRYPQGKLVQARIGHADGERDLALLVPKTIASQKGVLAARSNAPQAGTTLASFASGPNRSVAPVDYTVKNVEPVGRALVLELAPPPKPTDVGGPLLDARGHAVAIVVGCLTAPATPPVTPTAAPSTTAPSSPAPGATAAPAHPPKTVDGKPAVPAAGAQPCTKSAVGLPVAAVRSFLKALPPEAEPQGPWLGVDGISADTGVVRGIRIGRIEPKSPVSTLGLQVSTESVPGDLLVAVGGKPVPTVGALETALAGHGAGERVDLLVFGRDGYKIFQVRLTDPPAPRPSAPAR